MGFLTGTPEKFQQLPLLSKEQQPQLKNLYRATQGRGAPGAFGESADYYRNLISNDFNSERDIAQSQAPELRRFNEEIIPDLAEQFAGMGAGNLSSGSFRNAAVNAGTDLAERLGAIRQQLRSQNEQYRLQGAQGLTGIGQQGLGQYTENVLRPAQPGLLESVGGPLLSAGLTAFAGPLAGAAGSAATNWLSSKSSAAPKYNPSTYTNKGFGNIGGR